MSDPIYEIAYISEVRRPMSTMELGLLLKSCRERNQTAGVTGILLYAGRSFLQVIEGPRPTLEETLERIRLDDRHHRLFQLLGMPRATRSFASWSMGFVDGRATSTKLAGLTSFLEGGWTSHPLRDTRAHSITLIDRFRDGSLRAAVEQHPRQSQIGMQAVRIGHRN